MRLNWCTLRGVLNHLSGELTVSVFSPRSSSTESVTKNLQVEITFPITNVNEDNIIILSIIVCSIKSEEIQFSVKNFLAASLYLIYVHLLK